MQVATGMAASLVSYATALIVMVAAIGVSQGAFTSKQDIYTNRLFPA